jgi:hypothetical protein
MLSLCPLCVLCVSVVNYSLLYIQVEIEGTRGARESSKPNRSGLYLLRTPRMLGRKERASPEAQRARRK